MSERRRTYSPEVKEAVRIGLLAGQSVADVAARYNIAPSTVKSWKARGFGRPSVDDKSGEEWTVPAFGDHPSAQKARLEAGEMLLAYLAGALNALRALMNVVGDEAWLRQQRATEIAVRYRTLSDRVTGLLQALDNGARHEAAEEAAARERAGMQPLPIFDAREG